MALKKSEGKGEREKRIKGERRQKKGERKGKKKEKEKELTVKGIVLA